MFEFINDMGNYQDRKIDRTDIADDFFISTAKVSDGSQPYETGIAHPEYNDGKVIIVEAYDTKDQAKKGHKKWEKIMTNENLPDQLVDCQNAGIAQLCDAFGSSLVFKRQPK